MSTLTDVFGPGFVLLVALMWLALIVASLALPFVVFSIANSLRGIRRELSRMNGDAPAPARGGVFPNATVRSVDAPAPSLGHQFLK